MAASFGAETPMLNYGQRPHANPGGRNDRVWLGWPAWAFRVIAPEQRSSGLNALQKAALGVLRASRLTATELGHRLGIHRELAAFVVADLQGKQGIDSHWTVTETGLKLLEDEQTGSTKLVPGWVFRDGFGGRLLPVVTASLEYARLLPGDGFFPSLDLGTTGSPWHQSVWRVSAPQDSPSDGPTPREILAAAVQSQRLERRWHRIGTYDDEDSQPVSGIDIDRLTSIEPEPQPVYLVTYLYTPKGRHADGDWYACEFFGRGYDAGLRRRVIAAAADDQKLNELLDKRLFAGTRYGSSASFQRAAAARQARSQTLLARVLTIGIESHAVADPLRAMLDAYLEWVDLGNQRRARGVFTECRRALEALFGGLAKEHRLDGVWRKLAREDRELNESKIRAAAEHVGLRPLPAAMLRVKQGQVRAASDHNDAWRLRPLAVATLLLAKDDLKHPLAKAAGRDAAVIDRVERVALLGGGAVHQTEEVEPAETEQAVQETLVVCGLLLDLPTKALKEVMSDG